MGLVLSDDMTVANTIYPAWIIARKNRKMTPNHIFHSDRGVQYASNKITMLLGENSSIVQSMGRKGNYWDNAVAESFLRRLNVKG